MRPLYVTAAFLIAWTALAQEVKRPVLSSHDRINGPFAGEYHLEDLQVFQDGKVVYVEDGTKSMGVGQPERSVYEATIGSDDMRRLTQLLDSREIRSLPKNISAKIRPIDFFWQKSLEINRPDKTQKIQIENFYPFLNMHGPVYPQVLIELECTLQDIKATAAKRANPKGEDDWCKALVNQGKELTSQADCHEDEVQLKIVAGEGWGPARIGAASKTVDAFLGEGQSEKKYSKVFYRDYPLKGIQVAFENNSGTVHNIYFYNGQRDMPEFGVFCGQVDRGISWQSSVDDVKRAYGQPTAEFSGTYLGGTWKRLVFAGIDFRFENGKMVRIGIPGR
jgi:hypothetical protein